MPTLEHDCLIFRFPQIEKEARFSIDFQRTLRIPDSDETYPLPPGLGTFPLRHVEDHADKLPAQTTSRGGKGWEAVKRADLVRVLPPPIALVDWDEIEAKKKDTPGTNGTLFS